MVPGVVGRPSTAAAPAGRLRIAHCTGQHRRPRLVDAAIHAEPGPMSADEQGTNWRPPTERSVNSRQFAVQIPPDFEQSPSRHVSGSSTSPADACAPNLFRYTCDRLRYTRRDTKGHVLPRGRWAVPSQSRGGIGLNAVPLSDLPVSLPVRRFRYGSRVTAGRITRATSSIPSQSDEGSSDRQGRIQGCSQGKPNTRHERILSK